jgi:hypothetical protein
MDWQAPLGERRARSRRGCRRARGRAVLAWFLLGFALVQVAFCAVVDWRYPQFYDQEYAVRLDLLRRRLAEQPGAPLLAVVGSSRIEQGFRPEKLCPMKTPAGETALLFNFSHCGAGPRLNLLMIDRLLRQERIRPRWLVLEVMPLTLGHEMINLAIGTMGARDLLAMQKYFSPGKLWSVYLRNRLMPWTRYGRAMLRVGAPAGLAVCPQDVVELEPLGGNNHWLVTQSVTAAERHRRLDLVHREFHDKLTPFQMDPHTDQALRVILELCEQASIRVVLLLTPESSECRSFYPPAVATRLDDYIGAISRDYGVAVVDARDWLPDRLLHDGHHPTAEGADLFTRLLGERVLRPVVEGAYDDTKPDSSLGPLTQATDETGR